MKLWQYFGNKKSVSQNNICNYSKNRHKNSQKLSATSGQNVQRPVRQAWRNIHRRTVFSLLSEWREYFMFILCGHRCIYSFIESNTSRPQKRRCFATIEETEKVVRQAGFKILEIGYCGEADAWWMSESSVLVPMNIL